MYKTGGFTVYGDHEEDPGGLSILIRPHTPSYAWWSEATANVLKAMHNLPIKGASVLDLGCGGSVILGLAAKALGASEVVAVEDQPERLKTAIQQVGDRGIEVLKLVPSERKFDILLVNIGDEDFVKRLMNHTPHGVGTDVEGKLLKW